MPFFGVRGLVRWQQRATVNVNILPSPKYAAQSFVGWVERSSQNEVPTSCMLCNRLTSFFPARSWFMRKINATCARGGGGALVVFGRREKERYSYLKWLWNHTTVNFYAMKNIAFDEFSPHQTSFQRVFLVSMQSNYATHEIIHSWFPFTLRAPCYWASSKDLSIKLASAGEIGFCSTIQFLSQFRFISHKPKKECNTPQWISTETSIHFTRKRWTIVSKHFRVRFDYQCAVNGDDSSELSPAINLRVTSERKWRIKWTQTHLWCSRCESSKFVFLLFFLDHLQL
jgi:hypothetical protein